MKTYTIKPLVWKKDINGNGLDSQNKIDYLWVMRSRKGWFWSSLHSGNGPCRSLADGKRKAEAAYQARLATALEVCE